MSQGSNRAKRAQSQAIEFALSDMLEWYVTNSGGKVPDLAVDEKAYRGKVLRWFEPLLPGENPVLIEEALGDSWTLRLEKIQPKIMA